jgi:NADH:ubiquinone reductase (H+-translocating)
MQKKKIVIIGCGFAGAWAANGLARWPKALDVTVIDKNPHMSFLPCLPDVIGRGVDPRHLSYPIADFAARAGCSFIQAQTQSLDLKNRTVVTSQGSLAYDYVLVASGSETNFYGNDQIKRFAYKIDDVDDARRLREAVDTNDFERYLVAGAGYTGIEVATNLRRCLTAKNRRAPVIVVEKGPSLLGPLPEWMKHYVAENLRHLDIEVRFNSGITDTAALGNALLVWAAGVKTAPFVSALELEKTPQGRIKVDAYLRARPDCFFAGDTACFGTEKSMLRMAVQYAITQGACAAINIARSALGQKLVPYRPLDLGYVIPLANDRACGHILGMDMRGRLPLVLHYLMCAYRSYGWKNKKGLLDDVLRKTH